MAGVAVMVVATGLPAGLSISGLTIDWAGWWSTSTSDAVSPASVMSGMVSVRNVVLSTGPWPPAGAVTGVDHLTSAVHTIENAFLCH